MGEAKEMVSIPKEEYEKLLHAGKVLMALFGAGVDNWDGYDYAMESIEEE